MDFLTPDRLKDFVVGMVILILSIAVHEFGHAFVADKLGDRLPRSQGRVTLNPAAHAHPIGTLLIPGVGLLFFGGAMFGFGRPVMTNPLAYTRKLTMRTGHLLVAAAGPTMNVLFATFIGLVTLLLITTGVLAPSSEIYGALLMAMLINFGLAIFNLVPAPPLDGGTVLRGLIPPRHLGTYDEYAKYGIFIVLAFFIVPGLSRIISIPAMWLTRQLAFNILGLPAG
jgi:Zn-dependent protease